MNVVRNKTQFAMKRYRDKIKTEKTDSIKQKNVKK